MAAAARHHRRRSRRRRGEHLAGWKLPVAATPRPQERPRWLTWRASASGTHAACRRGRACPPSCPGGASSRSSGPPAGSRNGTRLRNRPGRGSAPDRRQMAHHSRGTPAGREPAAEQPAPSPSPGSPSIRRLDSAARSVGSSCPSGSTAPLLPARPLICPGGPIHRGTFPRLKSTLGAAAGLRPTG